MPRSSLPTRTLPDRPDQEQLKRQAKELLQAFTHGEAGAVAEVNAHYHEANPQTFALHDAQLVIARAYGLESWPRLKAFVDGATVRRLVEFVRAGNIEQVRGLLKVRPELAGMSMDNLQVVHHAVLAHMPEMVRLLMAHGANARDGVYPHRDATSAHAIALQRGYDEIVRIIEDEEQKRCDEASGIAGAPAASELFRAIAAGQRDRAIAMVNEDPAKIHARHSPRNYSLLHGAAASLDTELVSWLIDRGADPNTRAERDLTPLDMAASRWYRTDTSRMEKVVRLLLERGARMTAMAAAALGDAAWLRERHRAGTLRDQNYGDGGLLRIAITHKRPEILDLLLDLGFDPDERIQLNEDDNAPFSWGIPLPRQLVYAQRNCGVRQQSPDLLHHRPLRRSHFLRIRAGDRQVVPREDNIRVLTYLTEAPLEALHSVVEIAWTIR